MRPDRLLTRPKHRLARHALTFLVLLGVDH